jgi:hypothetical protein
MQRLKPIFKPALSARLKACPDTKQAHEGAITLPGSSDFREHIHDKPIGDAGSYQGTAFSRAA